MNGVTLRYPTFAGLLVVTAMVPATYFLFSGAGDREFESRLVHEIWNLGHVLYFALLVYLLRGLSFINRMSQPRQWVTLIAVTLLLGIAIEIAQIGTLRTPDWMDVSRDLVGCLLVLGFSRMPRKTHSLRTGIIRSIIAVLLLIHLIPGGIAFMDEAFARRQFPVLADFETPFELSRWSGHSQRQVVRLDEQSSDRQMRVTLDTGLHPGASLDHLVGDWRGFKSLEIRIYQPSASHLPITVRVHDHQHESGLLPFRHRDRFNRRFMLAQGWNQISIPLYAVAAAPDGRDMDLSRIRNLMLFTSRLPQPRSFFLESIYLAR